MKRIYFCISITVLFLCLFSLVPIKSHAFSEGNLTFSWYTRNGQTEVIIDGCVDSVEGELVIPQSIQGKPVTAIADKAFRGYTGLTSITIGDSVVTIGSSAFSGCANLTTVNLGSGLQEIGSYGFYECTKLTQISLPTSLTTIGRNAFQGCASLTAISIPQGITAIEANLFSECSSLSQISIPDTVTQIGGWAFSSCTSLTEIDLPDGITEIHHRTFWNCAGLTRASLPDGIVRIYSEAFQSCGKLKILNLGDKLTAIGDSAFQGCKSLNITIPKSVTSIGKYAFADCMELTEVTLSEGITTIKEGTFQGCQQLNTLSLPRNLTGVEAYAFYGCRELSRLTIPERVTSIGTSAFSACHGLTTVTIPDSVTSLGERALCACKGLTDINLGAGVATIGDDAFSQCDLLAGIWVDEKNPHFTSDDRGVLYSKDGTILLKAPTAISGSYSIPDSVTEINAYAFYQCKQLSQVTIGKQVSVIGDFAFWGNAHNPVYFRGNAPVLGKLTFASNQSGPLKVYYHPKTTGWTETVMKSVNSRATWILSHFFGAYTPDNNGTCNTDGTKTAVCSVCGITNTITDTGSAKHTYQNGICTLCGTADPALGLLQGSANSFGDVQAQVLLVLTPTNSASLSLSATVSNAQYRIPGITPGNYILTVSKPGHTPRQYKQTIHKGENHLDVTLHLTGDINGDGKINIIDVARIYAQVKDSNQLSDYARDCADLTGDGEINIIDTAKAYALVKKQ